jgi:hypothetical protein
MYKLYLVENTDPIGWGDFVKMVIKAETLNLAYKKTNDCLLKYYPDMNIKITELTQNYIKNSDTIICDHWNPE